MPRITDILVEALPDISASYALNVGEPSRLLEKMRHGKYVGDLAVHDFQRGTDLPGKSMVCIDGGRTSQKLAIGDLIVVGATLGEAADSKHLYQTEDEVPATAYATVIPHAHVNESLEGYLMSAMELRLLAETKADIRMIDGTYLNNAASVLIGLTGKSDLVRETLLELNDGDADGCLREALDLLVFPPHARKADVFALTKSDSSYVYARRAFGLPEDGSPPVSDRIMASRTLEAGEFFEPRGLISSRPAINQLKNFEFNTAAKGYSVEKKNLLRELIEGKGDQLRKLDNKEFEEKSILWTTYFKPSQWSQFAPAIKIEFPHHNTTSYTARDRAREIISYVDQDLTTEEFLEPWSQYQADRRAKDVSIGTDIVKNHLASTIEDPFLALGLLRGYRS